MKKIIIPLFLIFFAAILFFIIKYATTIFKAVNKTKTEAQVANTKYWKAHNKAIGETFVVDTVAYKVSLFKYKTKMDTASLFVEVIIKNLSSNPKKITDSSFALSGGAYGKIFYPIIQPISIAENSTQTISLIYNLPQNLLPSVCYYLNINSQKDSTQNGMITLYENYREGG